MSAPSDPHVDFAAAFRPVQRLTQVMEATCLPVIMHRPRQDGSWPMGGEALYRALKVEAPAMVSLEGRLRPLLIAVGFDIPWVRQKALDHADQSVGLILAREGHTGITPEVIQPAVGGASLHEVDRAHGGRADVVDGVAHSEISSGGLHLGVDGESGEASPAAPPADPAPADVAQAVILAAFSDVQVPMVRLSKALIALRNTMLDRRPRQGGVWPEGGEALCAEAKAIAADLTALEIRLRPQMTGLGIRFAWFDRSETSASDDPWAMILSALDDRYLPSRTALNAPLRLRPASLPASPAPFADTGAAHPVAQADAVQSADRDDAVPAAALGRAADAAAHGDAAKDVAGGAAAGRIQFRRVEVGDADLDPSGPANAGHGLDAEAVAVANIDDGAGEGATGPGLGRHGAAIGNAGAGVGQDGSGDGQGREKGEGSDHGSPLEPTEGEASNGFAAVARRIEASAQALEAECLRLDVEADWEAKLAQAQHLDRLRGLWLADPRVRGERQRLNPGKRALDLIATAVKFVWKAVKGKAADLVQQSQWVLGVPSDDQKQGRQQTFGGEQSAALFDVGIGQGVHALGNLTAVFGDLAPVRGQNFLDLKGEVDVHVNLSVVWRHGEDAESRGRETGPAAERAAPCDGVVQYDLSGAVVAEETLRRFGLDPVNREPRR